MCLGLPRRVLGGPHILLIFTHLLPIQRKNRLRKGRRFSAERNIMTALQLAVDDRAKVFHLEMLMILLNLSYELCTNSQ